MSSIQANEEATINKMIMHELAIDELTGFTTIPLIKVHEHKFFGPYEWVLREKLHTQRNCNLKKSRRSKMNEKIDELEERLLAEIMDVCWVRVNEENEILKELENKQNIICSQLIAALNEKAPELISVFDDYQSALMGKETEEDKAIYLQGAKDLICLFKKVSVL